MIVLQIQRERCENSLFLVQIKVFCSKKGGIKCCPWRTATIELSSTPISCCNLSVMHLLYYYCFYLVASLSIAAILLLDSLKLSCSWTSTPPPLSHAHFPLWPHVLMHVSTNPNMSICCCCILENILFCSN